MSVTESVTPREKIVARAVFLAVGYFKNADRDRLTRCGREWYDADKNRTATDIAYLLIRHQQGELEL